MTTQEFRFFQLNADGSAAHFWNLSNDRSIIACDDGSRMLVYPDGANGGYNSRLISITEAAELMPITFRHETNTVIAECGSASALYDLSTECYVADESDYCPSTSDGCWPIPAIEVSR